MTDEAPYPVRIELPVRWGEMDAFGHVNNTVYFRWFEDVRIATFDLIGAPTGSGVPSGTGPILATTQCDFVQSVTFPATVAISCRISHVGNSSMKMDHLVEDADDGTLYARGSCVIVMLDYQTGEKMRIPDHIRDAIDKLGA